MRKRIASSLVGAILGYLVGGSAVLMLVTAVLMFAVGRPEPMAVDIVLLIGCLIAGGVGGNKVYDRYWNKPRRSNDTGNEPDD
jgi:hypothetical protein